MTTRSTECRAMPGASNGTSTLACYRLLFLCNKTPCYHGPMNPVETLGLALGAGFSSGLNLYATIATLGLLQRFHIVHLPASLQVLAHPWVIGIAVALYIIEFLADKIPYVDTVWD